MTTAVQHRRGTTAEHSTFTGLEGEVTIDTTKDTAVIHDGVLAGGYPLAKETLANVNPSSLTAITGAATASDDLFMVYDASTTSMKKITRAELNNAMEADALANVSITGGTINGTTIGGTTAAAGAFTTLSASGAVTVSGNTTLGDASTDTVTVNGYMGVGGAGVSTAAIKVSSTTLAGSIPVGVDSRPIAPSTASTSIRSFLAVPGTEAASFTIADAAGYWAANASKGAGSTITNQHGVYIADQTQGTNNYGITSLVSSGTNKWNIYASGTAANYFAGNVGIGTSSPSRPAHVYSGTSTNTPLRIQSGVATGAYATFGDTNTTGELNVRVGAKGDALHITTGGVDSRAVLDSSGNLGLGVTPSAWNSSWKALQVNGLALWGSNTGLTQHISSNAVFDSGGYKYINTGFATDMYTDSGSYIWRTAPSGTAGNAISFTQAMTLTADGQLLVGRTTYSGIGKLNVEGGADFTGGDVILCRDTGNVGIGTSLPAAKLVSAGSSATNFKALILRNGDGTNGSSASIDFETSSGTQGSEAAMAGRVAGLRTGSGTSGALTFSTTNGGVLSERARINSSGNLLVGQTTPSGTGGLFLGANQSAGGGLISWNRANTTSFTYAMQFKDAGTVVGQVYYSNTSTSYATSSDYRLKDNIQDITGSGAFIDALQPRTWNWKADGSVGAGFIAHELQAVSPSSVVGEKDAVDADGNPEYQAVEYGSAEVIAMLVAEVKSLRARLTAAGL